MQVGAVHVPVVALQSAALAHSGAHVVPAVAIRVADLRLGAATADLSRVAGGRRARAACGNAKRGRGARGALVDPAVSVRVADLRLSAVAARLADGAGRRRAGAGRGHAERRRCARGARVVPAVAVGVTDLRLGAVAARLVDVAGRRVHAPGRRVAERGRRAGRSMRFGLAVRAARQEVVVRAARRARHAGVALAARRVAAVRARLRLVLLPVARAVVQHRVVAPVHQFAVRLANVALVVRRVAERGARAAGLDPASPFGTAALECRGAALHLAGVADGAVVHRARVHAAVRAAGLCRVPRLAVGRARFECACRCRRSRSAPRPRSGRSRSSPSRTSAPRRDNRAPPSRSPGAMLPTVSPRLAFLAAWHPCTDNRLAFRRRRAFRSRPSRARGCT